MDAVQLYLVGHVRSHPARAVPPAHPLIERHVPLRARERHIGDTMGELFRGMTDEELRTRPLGKLNSVAWNLWHMARSEDAIANLMIAGRPQVLDENGWNAALGVERRDIGTPMTLEECAAFDRAVNLEALVGYWCAVGLRTWEIVEGLTPEDLDREVPADRVHEIADSGVYGAAGEAAWFVDFWRSRTIGWFLALATHHVINHWGEAMVTRNLVQPDFVRPSTAPSAAAAGTSARSS